MMKTKDNVVGGAFAVAVAGFLLFFKMHPYFFWSNLFTNYYTEAIITIVIGVIFYINREKKGTIDKFLFLLLGLVVVLYPITSKQNFNVFVSVAPIVFIPFASRLFNNKVFVFLLSIYCYILIPSIIVWALHFTGSISPYKIIPPLNELKLDNYNIYPFLAIEGKSIRFAGPFDEPGVIGTVSALFLCINNMNLKDFKNIILFISGICSISLFFYVIIGMYYALSRIRTVKQMLLVIPTVVIAIVAVKTVPVLKEKIGDRLTWDSDSGTIAGDNRTALFTIETLDRVLGTREFWCGVDDKKEYVEKTSYSSSFLNVILYNGMIYFILVVCFYVLYGWHNKNDILSYILYLLVFFAVIFQRPNFNNPYYVFLWICLARQKEFIYSTRLN